MSDDQLDRMRSSFFSELDPEARLSGPPLVTGVILDFDYTLAHPGRPLDELLDEGARNAEAYMRGTGMLLPDAFHASILEAQRFSQEKSDEEQEEHLADDAMSFLLQFYGYPASRMDPDVLRQAVDRFYAPQMTAWRLRPGATEALSALRGAGCRLALLANHNCDRIFQRTVDYVGLRPYFDLCITSASVEYRKPDTALFQIVLDRWDALPYEVVVVGDSLKHDIQGGVELGALTVQVKLETAPQVAHDNAQLAGQVQPDAVIDDLRQLAALVRAWAV